MNLIRMKMMNDSMKLIYVGEDFYYQSGTIMSRLYTEDGQRSDWGNVTLALIQGKEVHIRPATTEEMNVY